MIKTNKIIIFSDGASKGNPGPGGYGAIVVLPEGKVVELGACEKNTTNNRMELSGALFALTEVKERDEEITVYTDSKYVIGGMTSWLFNWQKNNWRTAQKKEVLNKDLWEKLALVTKDKEIDWQYVAGHSGHAGNERFDEIASNLALGEKVDLYSGKLSDYKIDIF
jgi:ribonuclease HI